MAEDLSPKELENLIRTVFSPGAGDRGCAVFSDVPDSKTKDHDVWRDRRKLAASWTRRLEARRQSLGLETVSLYYYPNVGSHNAELPSTFYSYAGDPGTVDRKALEAGGRAVSLDTILSQHTILLAPTEFSTTAPLKIAAKKYLFRAATMPGFSRNLIPALRIDYEAVHKRVVKLKVLLDEAVRAEVRFRVGKEKYDLTSDLRFRRAHASGGLFPEAGTAGNLPSGESYIVPYEGEDEVESLSEGILPVQFGEEIVLYRVEENRAIEILSSGEKSEAERAKLREEPMYGNIAELGFGVLRDFGIQPTGELLLDEKLGFHVAFGRSDHFGGAVGPGDFRKPENVIHIDRIYISETQPLVDVEWVKLAFEAGKPESLMENGRYTIF